MHPEAQDNSTIWKPIPGLETQFLASNYGKIWTIKTGKVRKTVITPGGYELFTYYVGSWRAHKLASLLVHRAVALTFIPNPRNAATVNHKDGVKTNNYIENLEWATFGENIQHAIRTGLRRLDGDGNGHATLTSDQVREIRAKHAAGFSGLQLSKSYGVQAAAISKIITKRTWKTLT